MFCTLFKRFSNRLEIIDERMFLFLINFCFKDTEFSEWSDCVGIPCQIGSQQRVRTCLKQSICNDEQIQERNCFVSCENQNISSLTPIRTLSNGKKRIRIF